MLTCQKRLDAISKGLDPSKFNLICLTRGSTISSNSLNAFASATLAELALGSNWTGLFC